MKIDEKLVNLIRLAAPGYKARKLISAGSLIAEVLRKTKDFKTSDIWHAIGYLVSGGDLECRDDNQQEGFYYGYRLTKQGQENRPAKRLDLDTRDRKELVYCYHRGNVECKFCSSKNTASSINTTTFPVVPMFCFDCNKPFRKSARMVGAMKEDKKTKSIKGVKKMKTKSELKKMTVKELVTFFNEINPGDDVKSFESKAIALKRCEAALAASKKSGKGKKAGKATSAKNKVPSKKRKGPSRFQMIRDAFKSKKKITREALMKLTGWDAANVHTAMSILKNSNRTSADNLLVTEWDKASQTYTREN